MNHVFSPTTFLWSLLKTYKFVHRFRKLSKIICFCLYVLRVLSVFQNIYSLLYYYLQLISNMLLFSILCLAISTLLVSNLKNFMVNYCNTQEPALKLCKRIRLPLAFNQFSSSYIMNIVTGKCRGLLYLRETYCRRKSLFRHQT